MIEWTRFAELLSGHAGKNRIAPEDVLFGTGLNLSSIGFTEFIMELEEEFGLDIDVDDLDAGIRTAGQLHERINAQGQAGASPARGQPSTRSRSFLGS